MSGTSTKSLYLNNYAEDLQHNLNLFQISLNKTIRTHIRHQKKYIKISNLFNQMTYGEQSDGLKHALGMISTRIKALEEIDSVKSIQHIQANILNQFDSYYHRHKDAKHELYQRDKKLDEVLYNYEKLDRLRFQSIPDTRELHRTRSKLELYNEEMKDYETRVNQRHTDIQHEHLSDIKEKILKYIKTQLYYNIKATEAFSTLYNTVNEIDIEEEVSKIIRGNTQSSQF